MREIEARLACLEIAMKVKSARESLETVFGKLNAFADGDPTRTACLRLAVQETCGRIARVPVDDRYGIITRAAELLTLVQPEEPKPVSRAAAATRALKGRASKKAS